MGNRITESLQFLIGGLKFRGTSPQHVRQLLFLFLRYLPLISIFEMRELVAEEEGKKAAS